MSARTAGLTVGKSPTRCPFCHDGVDLDGRWVACRACLARHHTDCWADAGVCAACGVATCLADAGPANRDAEPATAAWLQRLESPPPPPRLGLGPFEYLGSLVSLGLLPLIVAESRLIAHARAALERDPQPPKPEAGSQAPELLNRTLRAAQTRRTRGALAFGLAVLVGLIGGAIVDASRSAEGVGVLLVGAATLGWVVALLTHLALHHLAVRRHEAAQLAATIRSQRLDAATTQRLVTRHEESWAHIAGGLRRGAGVAVLLSTVCFPVGWLPLPLWAARAFQVPLEHHKRRERLGALRW